MQTNLYAFNMDIFTQILIYLNINNIISTVIYKENLKISSIIQVNFFYIESHYNEKTV